MRIEDGAESKVVFQTMLILFGIALSPELAIKTAPSSLVETCKAVLRTSLDCARQRSEKLGSIDGWVPAKVFGSTLSPLESAIRLM